MDAFVPLDMAPHCDDLYWAVDVLAAVGKGGFDADVADLVVEQVLERDWLLGWVLFGDSDGCGSEGRGGLLIGGGEVVGWAD